ALWLQFTFSAPPRGGPPNKALHPVRRPADGRARLEWSSPETKETRNDECNETASGEDPAGWRDQGGDLAERKRARPLLRRHLRPELQGQRRQASRERQLLGRPAPATRPPGRQGLQRRSQVDQGGSHRERH